MAPGTASNYAEAVDDRIEALRAKLTAVLVCDDCMQEVYADVATKGAAGPVGDGVCLSCKKTIPNGDTARFINGHVVS